MTLNRVRAKGNTAKPFRTDGLPVPVREADLWPFPVP